MGKLESAIKGEVTRLARRELRGPFLLLQRRVRLLRVEIARLAKQIAAQGKKETARPSLMTEAGALLEDGKVFRFSPGRILGLRKKLGLSQRELAILAGVTLGAVAGWEKGKFEPKPEKKAALAAMRKMGKRSVKKMLAEMGPGAEEEKKKEKKKESQPAPKIKKGVKPAPPAKPTKKKAGK